MRVAIVKRLMIGSLLRPSIDLKDEILRERVVLHSALPGGVLGDHVEPFDAASALVKASPDVLIHAPNSIDWMILVQEDHVVFALVSSLRLVKHTLHGIPVGLRS